MDSTHGLDSSGTQPPTPGHGSHDPVHWTWTPEASAAPVPPTIEELAEMDPLDSFLRTLNLTDTGARTREDIFTGPNQWMPLGRVFGGQVAAQSVVAATRTVPDDRAVHSMHGYFLRPGDIRLPITFSVDRIHDGGSFSTRRVQAYQRGEVIWAMYSSFQLEQEGFEHQKDMPEGIPDPESLEPEADIFKQKDAFTAKHSAHKIDPNFEQYFGRRPFDIRHVNGHPYTQPTPDREPVQSVWLRAVGQMPDDPTLHRAALAYVSDYTIFDSLLRKHGLQLTDPALRTASLDHAMWWHRFARADEWLLYTLEATNSRGGRGLVFGRIYTRDGMLVASVTQEGMFRRKS